MHKNIINQEWLFKREEVPLKDVATTSFTKVTIPHTWNNLDGQDGGSDFHRCNATYVKKFMHHKDDKLWFIEFEGVNSIANVYLNGNHLGEHKGGYSTFRFNLTPYLVNGENTLVVYADNRHYDDVYPLMADFTFFGGIYRNVSLINVPAYHFDLLYYGSPGVYVTQKEVTKEYASLIVDAYVVGPEVKNLEVNVLIKDATGVVVARGNENAKVQAKTHFRLAMDIRTPHLWQGVIDPYLYNVEVTLKDGNNVLDTRIIPTGLRFFNVDHETFYLNGIKTRLNGVSRHQDRENHGNALSEAMHEEDMALIQEVGANSIRLAHYQQAQYFYDLCDKTGMVVWAEIPYISLTSKTDLEGSNAISQMRELVLQNYNHSSIVMWGISNEITIGSKDNNVDGILNTLNTLTKVLDPYRYTTMAHLSMVEPHDNHVSLSDIGAFNHYFGWYVGKTDDFKPWIAAYRHAQPKKALGISEYGVEGIHHYHSETPKVRDYSEEYHALWHEEVYDIFEKTPFIWGTYIWNMFAFASDMRDEGGVKGLNNKGLVTFDRKVRKDGFYYYKAKWSKEPVLHLNAKRFVERTHEEIKVKAYSNLGPVTFLVNGKEVMLTRNYDVIYEAVIKLVPGANEVIAKAGNLEEKAIFKLVEVANPSYTMPPGGNKGVIDLNIPKNWFDDYSEENNPLVINPEYLSVEDKIGLIVENPMALAMISAAMPDFTSHPMFDMAKNMTLRNLKELAGDSFPYGAFFKFNEMLQKIKK